MTSYILSWPWFVSATFIFLLISVVAVIGLFVFRRKFNVQLLKDHHDVSVYVFNLTGMIYAVLLGFTVSNVQERFEELHKTIETEAQIVLDLYRDAEVFPAVNRNEIRRALTQYVTDVIYKEWELMSEGKCSASAIDFLKDIWVAYYKMTPTTEKENIWYSQSVAQLNDFNSMRLVRVYNCRESMGPLMWSLLIVGAFITIASVYFFCVNSFPLKMLMTLFITGIISFMIFIIFALNHPFCGDMGIKPEALKTALNMFSYWN